jgi:O-antigen ligase
MRLLVVMLVLVVVVFFWSGMDVPLKERMETLRWIALGLATLVAIVMSLRRRAALSFGRLHLWAGLSVATALLSYLVSANAELTLLKSVAFGTLLVFAATGARLVAAASPEGFRRVVSAVAEATVWLMTPAYAAGIPVLGHQNSMGAIIGVLVLPVILLDILHARPGRARLRKIVALGLAAGWLTFSLARAALLAAGLAVAAVLFFSRRYRLLVGGTAVVAVVVLLAVVVAPELWEAVLENVVFKDQVRGNVLSSRVPVWERSLQAIEQEPWFGSGFGVTRGLSEWWRFSASTEGLEFERGSSYLALVEGVGVMGTIPFALLLAAIARAVVHGLRTLARGPSLSATIAVALVAALGHAAFEAWLFSPGYHLCLMFWMLAFILADQWHAEAPATVPRMAARAVHARR